MRVAVIQSLLVLICILIKGTEGLVVVDDIITTDKLTKELVDSFVEKVILKPERQVEIVWRFK